MANIYDMSDTWNAGATTFTAIKMNVVDTASASGSLLMDLQVGGSSKFSVAKGGNILFTGSKIQSSTAVAIFGGTGGGLSIDIAGVGTVNTVPLRVDYNNVTLAQRVSLGFTSGSAINTGSDLILARDAANTLGQRNSTNAQTFNLYNTYTDASNYERGFMKWNSNFLQIGTEAAGTGTLRNLRLLRGGTTVAEFKAGAVDLAGQAVQLLANSYLAIQEMSTAPAGLANFARIFSEDDGTGKTRLMVQFGTGAAVQIAIEP